MRQPGIEVRPIRMISGESEFNEVFYTDATCPKHEVVGGVNNGWAVAMSLLGYERGAAAATNPIHYQAELDRLLLLAKERGLTEDPIIRQRLAWCYGKVAIMRYLGMRILTQFLNGHQPGPDAAITKLYWSEYHQVATELALDIIGAEAHRAVGPQADRRVRHRRRRGAELHRLVGRRLLEHPGGDDLRRLEPDPAQHPRRDGPRPPEGAQAGVIRVAGAVLRHPTLWPVAVRAMAPHDAHWVVAAVAVPARPVAGVPPLPRAHPVRGFRDPTRVRRRCGELPRVVSDAAVRRRP